MRDRGGVGSLPPWAAWAVTARSVGSNGSPRPRSAIRAVAARGAPVKERAIDTSHEVELVPDLDATIAAVETPDLGVDDL